MNSSSTDTTKFIKDGYLVIKSVFTQEEVESFRSNVEDFDRSATKGQSKGDILTNSNIELSRVIYDSRILNIARDILGDVPVVRPGLIGD